MIAALLACCGRGTASDKPAPEKPPPAASPPADAASAAQMHPADDGPSCRPLPAADDIKVGEASGATLLPGPTATILIVGDSGNRGAYVELDAEKGQATGQGRLPLDKGASDDLEGLSVLGDEIVAITSSGWLRHWKRAGDAFVQTRQAYPVAASARNGMRCSSPRKTNCAANYEGLCLLPDEVKAGECRGFAASKRDGRLYCLELTDGGRLTVDSTRFIDISAPGTLSGCHFSPDGTELWAGTNILAVNSVYIVRGWQQPATTNKILMGPLGPGLSEAIAAAPDGLIYRFSDLGGFPSLLKKYRCD